jgi:hypothetical protein
VEMRGVEPLSKHLTADVIKPLTIYNTSQTYLQDMYSIHITASYSSSKY